MSASINLEDFVRESNRIEAIYRKPAEHEIKAHLRLLALSAVSVDDLQKFITTIAPGNRLRAEPGMNVRVGQHIAPPGGAQIVKALAEILASLLDKGPYEIHRRYETLHPFTDGNGRSGRALWLWMMSRRGELEQALSLGFLHNWYYQSLAAGEIPPMLLDSPDVSSPEENEELSRLRQFARDFAEWRSHQRANVRARVAKWRREHPKGKAKAKVEKTEEQKP